MMSLTEMILSNEETFSFNQIPHEREATTWISVAYLITLLFGKQYT